VTALPPRYPGPVPPPHSPAEPPPGGWRLPGPAAVSWALLRRYTARVLLSATHGLRDTADPLTRLRWHLEDHTPRDRAFHARHPSAWPHLTVVPHGAAQGRADAQFTYRGFCTCTADGVPMRDCGIPEHRRTAHHHAGHGASEGDPDL
jgi:hypothetical protein